MGRQVNRLSARAVSALAAPGRHADGGGLYLVVDKSGAKRWVFLFRHAEKVREMGLGGLSGVSLSRAREFAAKARAVVAEGGNPIELKRALPKPETPTFGEVADTLVADLSPQWRNDKHKAQWAMTLREYAGPLRGTLIDRITTDQVLAVLKPIWTEKPETAARLRGRIERVLDAARAKGLRSGENPARWKGHLDHLLPARRQLSRGHHAAMPFEEVPGFMTGLAEHDGMATRALEFCILTAARSGEVLGARWAEFDLQSGLWTVPRERMKAGREQRVPLGRRALAIVEALQGKRSSEFVFAGQRHDRPLSNMAMQMLLRRMNVEVTVHGFRSSFRDWAGELTSFPREVAEAALAHTVGDRVELAYRRGDALEKRRTLMSAWDSYVTGTCDVQKAEAESAA